MRPLTRALATATSLSGCLVLAGCGGNPTPAPPPKTSSSPTASTSATPSPPALPAAAREKTRAGAIAATKHFMQAMAYAGDTGDVGSFRSTYLASCTRCAAIATGIRTTYERGGKLKGGEWKPTKTKSYGIDGDIAYLDALVTFEPQTLVEANGKKTVANGSDANLKTFQLRWRDGVWRVAALDPHV